MKEERSRMIARFGENREAVKQAFHLESSYIYPVCAGIFTTRGVTADEDRLRECRRILKENTGLFSSFRGNAAPVAVSMLALETDPEGRMERAAAYYKLLKPELKGSAYLALAAFLLSDMVGERQAGEIAVRAGTLYRRMKKEHPLLTGREDSVLAVMLAFSEKDDDGLIVDMEACYRLLKEQFSDSDAVQSATHVLSLAPGTPEEKVARMCALRDLLKEGSGVNLKHRELAVLAAASILDVDIAEMASEILKVFELLKEQKGYGALGLDKRTRMMHAMMLVSGQESPDQTAETAALAGTLAVIAAQQAALCAIAASSAATSASAASH